MPHWSPARDHIASRSRQPFVDDDLDFDEDLAYERVMSKVDRPAPLSQGDGVIIPPVLYLPVRVDDAGRPAAEIRERGDGRHALLAFTALDRLVAELGEEQSWVLMPVESLGEVRDAQPFDVVAFDPRVNRHARRGGGAR